MARDRASRPEAKPLRLFIAVDVPEAVKGKLWGSIEPLRGGLADARWTKPEGWHVTLKFLGATWPRLLDEVRETVDASAEAAMPVGSALTEFGAFPSARRARVLWVGLQDEAGTLAGVARDLDERLRADFKVEKRAWTPHLTVARFRGPVDLTRAAPDLVGVPAPADEFAIGELVLYRSHLSPRGATYEPIHRAPFGEVAPDA